MLADFLFGPFRTRVLSVLFSQPDDAWHVRELARRIHALPGSTSRELIKLTDAGILISHRIGNQVHYRANRDCPIFDELAAMLQKTSGLPAALEDALKPLAENIQFALIFGSVARGEETTYSDVDILVLGDIGFAKVIEAVHPLQEKVQREINPAIYRTDDFCAKLASNNTWAREVVEKPKVFLIGDANDFAKLVENTEPERVQRSA